MATSRDAHPDFLDAVGRIAAHGASLGNAEKLSFYGLYKQATQGKCDTPRPSLFDMIGKAKWDAWSSLGDMPSAEASRRYIEEADRLVPASARGLKPKGAGAEDRSGFVVVSQPARLDDDDIGDDAKRLVDWCKEGDCERVAAAIHSNEDVNALDDTGMGPLHWACDRGHESVVALLLRCGADVGVRDAEGQTPLHFASACDHESVLRLLLDAGADPGARDNDGLLPADVASSERIRRLLAGDRLPLAPKTTAICTVQIVQTQGDELGLSDSDVGLSDGEGVPAVVSSRKTSAGKSWPVSVWLRAQWHRRGGWVAMALSATVVSMLIYVALQRRRRAVPIRFMRR